MGFAWIAKYKDSKIITSLQEGVSFERIPRRNLWLIDIIAPNRKKILTLEVKPGYNVFYRRRAVMEPGQSLIEAVVLLGYQVKGTDISVVTFIYESDWRIEVGDFRRENESMASMQEYKHEIEYLPSDLETVEWD